MSTLTIFGIEAEIKKHKQLIADLEVTLDLALHEPEDQQLATELHNLQCHSNHTDGCGWFYEISKGKDDWEGRAHARFLKKAQTLIHDCELNEVTVDQAITMFKLVRQLT
jgi:hypothetical protein